MLKGKKVITNDGKDIGEIKDISDNYIRLEKGSIK
ncbi:MAG: PRC-barrel domain-containing protein, partial [Nitrososphaeraceae archaeon]